MKREKLEEAVAAHLRHAVELEQKEADNPPLREEVDQETRMFVASTGAYYAALNLALAARADVQAFTYESIHLRTLIAQYLLGWTTTGSLFGWMAGWNPEDFVTRSEQAVMRRIDLSEAEDVELAFLSAIADACSQLVDAFQELATVAPGDVAVVPIYLFIYEQSAAIMSALVQVDLGEWLAPADEDDEPIQGPDFN